MAKTLNNPDRIPSRPSKHVPKDAGDELSPATKMLLQRLVLNSELVTREQLNKTLGKSFNGKRDMYEVLGYPKSPKFEDYLAIYERDGLAATIVDKVSDETWRKPPFLLDEDQEAEDAEDNPGALQEAFADLADQVKLYKAFSDLDAACGYSRFALLFMGLPGELKEPATSGDLLYVTVYDEGQVTIKPEDLEKDATSERFGMPNRYWINMEEGKKKNQTAVHYTRILHVKEGRGRSLIYGVPRLRKSLNRLYDLEKVVGSSSEAFWLMVYKGFMFTAKEGAGLPVDGSAEDKKMREAIDEYVHGLRRFLTLEDLDLQDQGGTAISGKEQFEMICSYLAGSNSIPQRILLGSERGNLASSQDDANFSDYIQTRQVTFAEPDILRAFIDHMGLLGILDVPEKYVVKWPSLFSLNDKEKADLANTVASAINTASGSAPEMIMPGKVFAKRYLDYVPKKGDGDPDPELEPEEPEPTTEPLGDLDPELGPDGKPLPPKDDLPGTIEPGKE